MMIGIYILLSLFLVVGLEDMYFIWKEKRRNKNQNK